MSHDIPKASLDALVKRIQIVTEENVLAITEQFERLIHELKRAADALEMVARNGSGR